MINATDFFSEEEYQAALDERVATDMEAVHEMAWAVGQEHSDRAWLLDDRDFWVRNPYYVGPEVRHPEADYDDDEEPRSPAAVRLDQLDDFIPF